MKSIKKILGRVFVLFLLLFILAAIVFRFVDFSMSEETIEKAFEKTTYSPNFRYVNAADRQVHYVQIGDTSKPAILFVHGSPGSWDNFLNFMIDSTLLKSFQMLAIDRLGFGKSGSGNPSRSLEMQARAVLAVLHQQKTNAYLVGHSYGGPVIVKAAILKPERVCGLLLVAASVDPALEDTKWYQVPIQYSPFSWILPPAIFSTNEEILALKTELREMDGQWKDIFKPVTVIQGGKDRLVPPENAHYAMHKLSHTHPELVFKDEVNHFIPWNQPELIKNALLKMHKTQTDSLQLR